MPVEGRDRKQRGRSRPQPASRRYDPLAACETILERADLNVVTYDCDLMVREASRLAAELLGTTREQLRGSSYRDYLLPEQLARCERVLAGERIEIEETMPEQLSPTQPWVHLLMLPLRDAQGSIFGGASIIADASDRHRADELAEKLALIDPLTELPNRRMLTLALDRALQGAKGKRRQLALLWLNLDRFADVNQAFGHEAGDVLLKAVAGRLADVVRSSDMVARVDGDEFALLLSRINSRAHLKRLVGRIEAIFAAPFIVASESLLLTASIGVAVHPDGGSDADELAAHAHVALHGAKALGGDTCEIYQESFAEDAVARVHLAGEIADAIEQEQFVLHYQPQVALDTLHVQAVEALVRWDHPERGLLAPSEFIGFAEETAMIVPLGRHILTRACADHRSWHDRLGQPPRLAINVSAREFQRTDVCEQVCEIAAAAGVAPSWLEIEITETAVLADPERAAETARSLRAAGATVALDDFGTGHSSLTHLYRLPIDRIKIDRSFVALSLSDPAAATILSALARLAHELGMEVVAEGVETAEQLDFVRQVGCDAAQGYHLAKPMPHGECTNFLLRNAGGAVL